MNNLYYGFRGDPGQRAPQSVSAQPSSQPLLQNGKDQGPQNGLAPFPLSNPLNGSMRHANSSSSSIPFPTQTWASDLPSSTSQSQLLHRHPQLNFSQQQQQQQQNPSTAAFQATQSMRPGTMGLSGGRVPVSARQPAYDDGVYHMINKGFPEASATGNAGIQGQPESLLSTRMSQPAAQQDMYSRHASLGGNAVFDPSEFPSLGGGANPSQTTASNTSALLSATAGFDSMAANFTAQMPNSVNGMAYSDLYSMGAYSNTRSKAVDALTGSGPAGEFSMQSEDFPALGGGTNGGNSARPGNGAAASQASVLDGAASGHSRISGIERGALSSADAYFNVSAQPPVHDQFGGGSESHLLPNVIGSSIGSAQIPQSSAMPYAVSKGKGSPTSLATQDRMNSQQLGQQAMEELAHMAPIGHVERQSVRTTIGQGLFDSSGVQAQGAAYINPASLYASRGQRAAGGSLSVASGPNSDGNAPNRDALSKMPGDTVSHSDAQDSARRTRLRGLLPSSANGQAPASEDAAFAQLPTAGNSSSVGVNADASLEPSEKYGMKGLLGVLNPAQGEQGPSDIALLSLGLDLTMLGLNLNSNEPLHLSFESPWDAGQPNKSESDSLGVAGVRSEEPDFKLPACYYMSPPALKTSHFSKFQLETLFYIFYNMPRDVLQQLAAIELNNREWRYHKDLKLWFTRAPGTDSGYERGAYIYFDIKSWERRPFHDAKISFEQGLMTGEELHSVHIPPHMSSA